MTTLATDGITLAADGQITCGDVVESLETKKVVKLPDGTVVGWAGCVHAANKFVAWLQGGEDQNCRPDLTDSFVAIRINGTSEVLSYDADCHAIIMPAPHTAGSGGVLALGAMLAGASPREAVMLACKRDVYSGGKITALKARPRSS